MAFQFFLLNICCIIHTPLSLARCTFISHSLLAPIPSPKFCFVSSFHKSSFLLQNAHQQNQCQELCNIFFRSTFVFVSMQAHATTPHAPRVVTSQHSSQGFTSSRRVKGPARRERDKKRMTEFNQMKSGSKEGAEKGEADGDTNNNNSTVTTPGSNRNVYQSQARTISNKVSKHQKMFVLFLCLFACCCFFFLFSVLYMTPYLLPSDCKCNKPLSKHRACLVL